MKVKNSKFDVDDPEAMRNMDFYDGDLTNDGQCMRDLGLDNYEAIKHYEDNETD